MRVPRLIQIQTVDGLTLPGILYESGPSRHAAIHVHGNGSTSVFYRDDRPDEVAHALNRKGISLLVFNNRGAHIIKRLTTGRETKNYGMAYEKIKDCIKDIDGAIGLLVQKGYKKFYLIGESTGANKICVYHYYKPRNRVSKYILLGGADDVGIYYHALGRKKFFSLLNKARRKIQEGKGDTIIADLVPEHIFAYTGFHDIANPDGDYNVFPFYEVLRKVKLSKKPFFRHYRSIKKPTLVVYGEFDQYAWGDVPRVVRILKAQKPEFDYAIIQGADHSCTQHQRQLGQLIARWL